MYCVASKVVQSMAAASLLFQHRPLLQLNTKRTRRMRSLMPLMDPKREKVSQSLPCIVCFAQYFHPQYCTSMQLNDAHEYLKYLADKIFFAVSIHHPVQQHLIKASFD